MKLCFILGLKSFKGKKSKSHWVNSHFLGIEKNYLTSTIPSLDNVVETKFSPHLHLSDFERESISQFNSKLCGICYATDLLYAYTLYNSC